MTDPPRGSTRPGKPGTSGRPAGWRAVYLESEQRTVFPVAGWLIQDSYLYDSGADKLIPDDDPERRVIPGTCTEPYGWLVEPVDLDKELLWMILGPGEPEPTDEDEAAERARREEDRRQRRG